MTERRADDATREVNAWLKCEYLQQHVGEEFPGVISAVTSFRAICGTGRPVYRGPRSYHGLTR